MPLITKADKDMCITLRTASAVYILELIARHLYIMESNPLQDFHGKQQPLPFAVENPKRQQRRARSAKTHCPYT
jgi:hypothetical protein